jgi:hypothetical protein
MLAMLRDAGQARKYFETILWLPKPKKPDRIAVMGYGLDDPVAYKGRLKSLKIWCMLGDCVEIDVSILTDGLPKKMKLKPAVSHYRVLSWNDVVLSLEPKDFAFGYETGEFEIEYPDFLRPQKRRGHAQLSTRRSRSVLKRLLGRQVHVCVAFGTGFSERCDANVSGVKVLSNRPATAAIDWETT